MAATLRDVMERTSAAKFAEKGSERGSGVKPRLRARSSMASTLRPAWVAAGELIQPARRRAGDCGARVSWMDSRPKELRTV